MLDPASPAAAFAWGEASPALPLLIAGAIAAVTPLHLARKALALAAPLAALAMWLAAEYGEFGRMTVAGVELVTFRFDGLSRIFGFAFILAAGINALFALHERSRLTDAAALIYAGAAVGAVFAGDLVTLFVFWELTAVASAFLIWAGGGRAAVNAGLRYLTIQVGSGVLLLLGASALAADTGSFAFNAVDPESLGGRLLLVAFGVKAAFPLLHNWLQDAYPRATAVGAVVLSAFTTKLAVYALARGFAGYEPLIWIGAIMTVFPVFFAVIENDLRRVLSYSINNQLGFMVCGVGVGTALAVNGAAAHALADIVFKGLLFMSMGAVLHRVGTTRATDLGGLYKAMPFTALFCMVGAASISAFPLFSAFVTKSMILSAVAHEGHWLVWLMLLFASAGVLEHAGIKIPYYAFFAHDSGRRPKEAPANMLAAMAIAAFFCVYLGVNPGFLASVLPNKAVYDAYTVEHIVTQMQLLIAAIFAFALLKRLKLYPPEQRGVILDSDWLYRRLGADLVRWLDAVASRANGHWQAFLAAGGRRIDDRLNALFSPASPLNRAVPNGALALWTALILAVALLVAYLAPR